MGSKGIDHEKVGWGYDDALRQWMGDGDDEQNKNTQSIEVQKQ